MNMFDCCIIPSIKPSFLVTSCVATGEHCCKLVPKPVPITLFCGKLHCHLQLDF
ncbi:hypothetical protein HanRHA438_Chr07g0305631 [Helianthus annuus]|nr:hypothetical protein HanRHA438_Chr07g0305631 [Helianthus annuus]